MVGVLSQAKNKKRKKIFLKDYEKGPNCAPYPAWYKNGTKIYLSKVFRDDGLRKRNFFFSIQSYASGLKV